MGSKEPKPVTQTNTVQLAPEAQEIADLSFPFAQQFAKNKLEIPNWQVAGFNPVEQQAQQGALTAAGQMQPLAQQAAASNQFLMDPSILSPDSNPYVAAQGDAITQTMTRNFTENMLPALRAGSVTAGGMNSGGNTRFGVAQGLAADRTNEQIGTALTNLYSGAYNTGLNAMSGAIGQNPNVMQGMLYPSTVQSGVGAQQRSMEQAQLVAAANNDWFSQMLPMLQAQHLYGIINSIPGSSGVTTVDGAMPGKNPIMSGLGGAASGAMLGSMIMPGIGTAIGGGLGALGGLL